MSDRKLTPKDGNKTGNVGAPSVNPYLSIRLLYIGFKYRLF